MSPPPTTGLIPSFVAAIQASLSVLLVISYGSLAAHFSLLTPQATTQISKICVRMFLPALLLTQIGSQLHPHSLPNYISIFIWAIFCHLISFFVGVAAHFGLGMEDWVTAAVMFNNTTSYPLLLIQSLDGTGILESLLVGGEGVKEGIERAKSYFLVFATVSSCLTFAVGPRLIEGEHAPDVEEVVKDDVRDEEVVDGDGDGDVENGNGNGNGHEREVTNGEEDHTNDEPLSPTDQTHLLSSSISSSSFRHPIFRFFPSRSPPRTSNSHQSRSHTLSKAPTIDRRPSLIPHSTWIKLHQTTKWYTLLLYDFLNAPLLGAILGTIIGLIPTLHTAFFAPNNEGGVFTAWLTASLKNIGGLFVPLPVVVAGVSLYTSYVATKTKTKTGTQREIQNGRRIYSQELGGEGDGDGEGRGGRGGNGATTPLFTTGFILLIRFVVWPVMSIALMWFLVKEKWLGDDPMLWFTMMLMPTGPPAMKYAPLPQSHFKPPSQISSHSMIRKEKPFF